MVDDLGFSPEDYARAREFLTKLYGDPIGEGRHRIVFREGNHVVKCPTSSTGCLACWDEAEVSPGSANFALGLTHPLSTYLRLPVVWQEWVEHTGTSYAPDWTWSIDCGQVGRTVDGRLVAYDWDNY